MAGKLILKRGKDKPLRNHHPWIFSGAIHSVENVNDGDTVNVYDAGGQWLARAAFNSRSQIAGRVWTFERDQPIDQAYFRKQIQQSFGLRRELYTSPSASSENLQMDSPQNSFRLVNAESDGIPGLVIDNYGGFLVVQSLTLGTELHKTEIVEVLQELFSPRGVYERSDVDVRKKEGLKETTGNLDGEEPPDQIEIVENGVHILVDVKRGHKTGFYLDQRVNRERATKFMSGEVLNAFAYTGAFGLYAGRHNNAHVTNLDASASSLELARENFERNELQANAEYVVADAFEKLREYRTQGKKFDAIVLDPPKFVTSQANLERAARGYKDLNMLAFQLLNPNGHLITFSCSGLVDAKLFQQIVFGAAVDAKRDAQILEKLGHSPDHPIGLYFPEGEYLKGLILRAI